MANITNQQVYDAFLATKSELEAVNAKLAGTLATQLTGRNVKQITNSSTPASFGRWFGEGVGSAASAETITPWDLSGFKDKVVRIKSNRSTGTPSVSIYLTTTLDPITSPGFTNSVPDSPIPTVLSYKLISAGVGIGEELLIDLSTVKGLNVLAAGMFAVVQGGGNGTDEVTMLVGAGDSSGAILTGDKVEWIQVVNASVLGPNNNTSLNNNYKDVSGFDEVEVYVLSDQPYDLTFRTRKADASISHYLPTITGQAATTGTVANVHRVEVSGVAFRADQLNPVFINRGESNATVSMWIRGYRKVKA